MIGKKFTRLTVRASAGRNKSYEKMWLCECECGNTIVARDSNLKRGATRSCGCLRNETLSLYRDSQRGKNEWAASKDGLTVTGTDGQGRSFVIDANDFEKVKTRYWRVDKLGYVYSDKYKSEGSSKGSRIRLHRYLMGDIPEGKVVDHINHDPSDNRRSNLRIATPSENTHNRKVCGVTFNPKCPRRPWMAMIANGKDVRRRWFTTAEEAIKQRQLWEEELYGRFAYMPEKDAREDKSDRFQKPRELAKEVINHPLPVEAKRPRKGKPHKLLHNMKPYTDLVSQGLSVVQVCEALGISRRTYFNYRKEAKAMAEQWG